MSFFDFRLVAIGRRSAAPIGIWSHWKEVSSYARSGIWIGKRIRSRPGDGELSSKHTDYLQDDRALAKKTTIREIASKARVSMSTVSRVLNGNSFVEESKKQAVKEAVDALNYSPNAVARSLVKGQTYTIGVVSNDLGSPFNGKITQGIAMGLQATKYSPVIVDALWSKEMSTAAVESLVARSVDALIFVGGDIPVEELDQLRKKKPTLVIARELPEWSSDNYFIDNFAGAYSAAQYLIKAGHREIAFVSGIEGRLDSKRRFEGFNQALEEHQITFREELYVSSDFTAPSAVAAAETLLERQSDFSAVFCCNDQTAFGLRKVFSDRGLRVPEEVSIVGFDDDPLSAYMSPPLTTVRQPVKFLGREAAKAVVNLLSGEPVDSQVFKPELIIRESVTKLDTT
ncbi:MAG: LacI family DNA-binding transcriptional regulator [Planctomycetota bacterium]